MVGALELFCQHLPLRTKLMKKKQPEGLTKVRLPGLFDYLGLQESDFPTYC